MSGAFNSCWSRLEVLATWLLFFLLAPTQNSKSLEKSAGSRDPEALKTCRGPKHLPSHLSAQGPLQGPRTTDLQSCQTNSRPLASKGTGWILTPKVYRGPGCFAYTKHWGIFWGKKEGRWRVYRSVSCLWHSLAPWPHLQAAETSAGQAHGPNDHVIITCSEQKLYPDHGWQQAKQATTPEKWSSTGISLGSSSF